MFKHHTCVSFFNEEECTQIVNYSLDKLKLKKAETSGNINARKSQIAFNDYRIDFPKIVEKLENKLIDTIKIKGYELSFKETKYQFTEYKPGDFYDWHIDSNPNNENKDRYCSIVIQLSNDYTGGVLELVEDDKPIQFSKGIGNVFIFLSNKLHRVTQVESGVRYSLVGWFALKTIKNYQKTLL